MTKGQEVYYTQIFPTLKSFNVLDLIVRTVGGNYYVAEDKRTKYAYTFTDSNVYDGETITESTFIFQHRKDALEYVLAEERKYELLNEI